MEPEWVAWAKRYTKLFGLTDPQDAAMVMSWVAIFKKDGFAPAVVEDATDWIASNEPPRHRLEHFHILQKRLRSKRNADHKKGFDAPPPGEMGKCADCNGTGMLCDMPHPRAPDSHYTCAVRCHCAMGRWLGEHQQGRTFDGTPRAPLISYEHYCRLVPDWQERVRMKRELAKMEAEARSTASTLDKLRGQLLSKWPSKRPPGSAPRPNPDA